MEKVRRLIWDDYALVELIKSLKWISKRSLQEAEKVEAEILDKVELIRKYPERYPLDKYKSNNPGNYRAVEIYSFRITYRHEENEMRILRFRHVKQEPFEY